MGEDKEWTWVWSPGVSYVSLHFIAKNKASDAINFYITISTDTNINVFTALAHSQFASVIYKLEEDKSVTPFFVIWIYNSIFI